MKKWGIPGILRSDFQNGLRYNNSHMTMNDNQENSIFEQSEKNWLQSERKVLNFSFYREKPVIFDEISSNGLIFNQSVN